LRRRRAAASRAGAFSVFSLPSNPDFLPVDFFESCNLLAGSDLEFGGSELLQVYNVQQLKYRLQTSGLYVACTRPAGFSLEVTNLDGNQVIAGVRVHLGTQDATRVPTSFEIFGRAVHTTVTRWGLRIHRPHLTFFRFRPRWFDFPFTMEEMLKAEKSVRISFGPSADPGGVSFVDCVHVYGKTKEAVGWAEENDEANPSAAAVSSSEGVGANAAGRSSAEASLWPIERLAQRTLSVLRGGRKRQCESCKLAFSP